MPNWLPKLLCLIVLASCATVAHAQVFRCIGAHGEPVFSGQPCANPVPVPGDSVVAQDGGNFGQVCVASPQALRDAIAAAFFSRDVNRLAGLLLWTGFNQASARDTLRSLADWLKQPLAGIAVAYATGPPVSADNPAPPASAGRFDAAVPTGFEVSTGGGEGSTRTFGVTETEGCWWLTF